jgi:hypothetical protein
MSREAMQMALEALEDANDVARMEFSDENYYSEAINALRQALETEQEPVAWMCSDFNLMHRGYSRFSPTRQGEWNIPVYTAPPKREWVGLTDEEIQDLGYLSEKFDASNSEWFDRWGFARAIEAKLKEKNKW